MAIRLLASYEFIDKDGNPAGMVRLPVVDYAEPDSEGLDDGPQGHAVLPFPQRDDRLGSRSGPVSTRDLLGVMHYRREDEAA